MADVKISALPAAGALAGTEVLPIVQAGATKQATINALLALLVDTAPGTLDTLNELAAALGDDAAFATTVTNALAAKMANTVADANSILYAVADNTPAALAMAASRIPARLASGDIVAATVAQIQALLKTTVPVAEFTADVASTNVDGTEDDLFATTLTAGLLATNKDKVSLRAGGINVGSATATRKIKVYFGTTAVFDSSAYAITANNTWDLECLAVRVSASVVRATTRFMPSSLGAAAVGAVVSAAYTEVTGLTLANTQAFKVTGAATGVGAAAADIVAKVGAVGYQSAA